MLAIEGGLSDGVHSPHDGVLFANSITTGARCSNAELAVKDLGSSRKRKFGRIDQGVEFCRVAINIGRCKVIEICGLGIDSHRRAIDENSHSSERRAIAHDRCASNPDTRRLDNLQLVIIDNATPRAAHHNPPRLEVLLQGMDNPQSPL